MHAYYKIESTKEGRRNAFKAIGDRYIKVTYRELQDEILIISVVDKSDIIRSWIYNHHISITGSIKFFTRTLSLCYVWLPFFFLCFSRVSFNMLNILNVLSK